SAPQAPQPAQAFRCLFCRLSFGTELEMQLHLAAHSKQFRCPLCQEAFHVEFLLDKHLQAAHSSQLPSDALLKAGGGDRAGSGASERAPGDADADLSGGR
ncbi:Zinc finger protein 423 homolog, partial [Gryllus bimaculatus]